MNLLTHDHSLCSRCTHLVLIEWPFCEQTTGSLSWVSFNERGLTFNSKHGGCWKKPASFTPSRIMFTMPMSSHTSCFRRAAYSSILFLFRTFLMRVGILALTSSNLLAVCAQEVGFLTSLGSSLKVCGHFLDCTPSADSNAWAPKGPSL